MVGSSLDWEINGGKTAPKRLKIPGFDFILVLADPVIQRNLKDIIEYARKTGIVSGNKRWFSAMELEEIVKNVLEHIIKTKDWDAPIKPDEAETLYYYHFAF